MLIDILAVFRLLYLGLALVEELVKFWTIPVDFQAKIVTPATPVPVLWHKNLVFQGLPV